MERRFRLLDILFLLHALTDADQDGCAIFGLNGHGFLPDAGMVRLAN
jgi:hypothetical protein